MSPHSSIGRWCGPTALAVALARSYEDALALFKRNKRQARPSLRRVVVKGVYAHEMTRALSDWGARALMFRPFRRNELTFKSWRLTKRDPDRVYIVMITGHFVTVYGNTIVDNCYGAQVLDGGKFDRRQVVRWWRI